MSKHIVALLLIVFALPVPAQLVPDGAELEKVADGYRFTEGPALIGTQIAFTDIPASKVLIFDPETGETQTFIEDTQRTNGLLFHRGLLYGCSHGRRAVVAYAKPDQAPRILCDTLPADNPDDEPVRFNSPNDLAIDSTDGIYFTDPRYGNRDDMQTDVEGVYYFRQAIKGRHDELVPGREGALHRIDGGLGRPNGIVLSPDESVLYVADNAANWIYAYDIKEPGKVENKRPFARINGGGGGGSDGMCVDKQGRLYATGHGKVWVFEPTGELVATIDVGPATTNCTFGADGKTLYITANKGLYRITLDTDAPLEYAENKTNDLFSARPRGSVLSVF